MIALTNRAKDLIGSLRTVNFLLLLGQLKLVEFPLDPAIEQLLKKYKPDLDNLLGLVSNVAVAEGIKDELRSAIDDILPVSDTTFYDTEATDLLLTLYSGTRKYQSFHYDNLPVFHQELKKLFDVKLGELINNMLWSRVSCYDYSSKSTLPSPVSSLLQVFMVVHKIVPDDVKMSLPDELLTHYIKSWLQSKAVQQAFISNVGETNGFTQVVKEIRELGSPAFYQKVGSQAQPVL